MAEWKKIEALLFASGKYLTEEKISELSGLAKDKVKRHLKTLKKKYDEADTSLAVFNELDAWKLNVKEEFTDVISSIVSDAEMSKAVMETLAVIAYKSPVLQSEVKNVRGVTSYDHIGLLESKGFISRERQGRSYKIRLTSKFHEYFDIDGDSKLAELFKDVKKPDESKKLGELEVYDENDKEFDSKILERMEKLERTKKDDEDENKFLNGFDEKFEKTRQNINDSENEIDSFKKRTEDDSDEIFGKEKEEGVESEEKSEKENEASGAESESKKESEEARNDSPEFLKKVNEQINELTKGTSYEDKDEFDSEISEESDNELDSETKKEEVKEENLDSEGEEKTDDEDKKEDEVSDVNELNESLEEDSRKDSDN